MTSYREVRAEWEQHQTPLLTLPVDGFAVYVLLKSNRYQNIPKGPFSLSEGPFSLHRYFPIGKDWQVSVDLQSTTLEKCLATIQKHPAVIKQLDRVTA